MTVTITYEEFDRFWGEVLGDDWYIDECDAPESWIEGTDSGASAAISALELGWQGGEPKPTEWITRRDLARGPNFFTLLKRWRAKQKVTYLTVQVPTQRREEFLKMVAEFGGRLTT